ncbi:hypothetical protein ACFWB1_26170 [Streptomyces goshikiensis]|uniref:hypothetical protein n=1 Tax=Streptomyces goshikiensis TaxID=1942 RepID=UPI003692AB62
MEAEQQQSAGQEGKRARSWGSARAALAGTLIGALAGLAGSVLGYYDAGKAREAAAEARRADIRRQAYAAFGTKVQDLATEMESLRNFLIQYQNGISTEELKQQNNDEYVPALQRILQEEVNVRLVGTPEARKWLAKTVPPRKAAVDLLGDRYLGRNKAENWADEMGEVIEKYRTAVEIFMKHVDAEVF